MNQILFSQNFDEYLYNYQDYKDKEKKKNYLIVFLFSIIICIFFLSYLIFSFFNRKLEKQKTDSLLKKYNISSIYSYNNSYSAVKLSNNISIIGLIEIPSIEISYPILSNCSDELLKISICKFSGPFPNNIGNMCLAGHNYKNNSMFSKLNKLNIGDSIFITDLNANRTEYIIFAKSKINQNDWNCIQSSNFVELTLITCNSVNNSERIMIKAKVKG